MALTQQDARDLGYTGAFGSGGFNQWIASQSKDIQNKANARADARKQGYTGTFGSGGYNEWVKQQSQPKPVTDVMSNTINNPQLANGSTLIPQNMTVNSNELLTGLQAIATQGINNVPDIQAPTINTQQGQSQQIDQNSVLQNFDATKGKYEASLVGNNTPQAQAQQGQVSREATVKGQLQDLYAESEAGKIPDWAKGAVTAANEAMAARGLGASSIASGAITAAVQQSAINIAAQDANTYFQMDMANLNNRQQTELFNTQLRQQSLLTDTAAENAAKQFNAASESQVQQFQASLVASIQSQNAALKNSMEQFNVGQANAIAATNAGNALTAKQFNAQKDLAIKQFNSQLGFARDTFNSQMAFAIEQSNVQWRRNVNTANTATQNAANQINTQNRFNMSTTALAALWQEWRDNASWAFVASENDKNRQYNMMQAANERAFTTKQDEQQWLALAGSAAFKAAMNWLES